MNEIYRIRYRQISIARFYYDGIYKFIRMFVYRVPSTNYVRNVE